MNESSVIERMIRECRRLDRWLAQPGNAQRWKTSNAFARLELCIERLPPHQADEIDLTYFRNRVPSSRRLWEDGEAGAARYQMREMRRKLEARVVS